MRFATGATSWCCVLLVALLSRGVANADDGPFEPAALEFFEREVRPLLVARCHECHGPEQQKGGLRIDSRDAIISGGDTGPAIEPGDPDQSLLIDAIRYGDSYQMPPKSQLPQAEIDVLVRWVRQGAPWPNEQPTTTADGHEFNLAERAAHWAYQPLRDVHPPEVRDADWPSNPIDAFILYQLEAQGIAPSPRADDRTWLRRVTFDLTGLPPTEHEIASFLADESTTARDKVVERLLASPRYGERWARHWLDLVRYAETYGHEFDFDIPQAYRYRDYVIRALNDDVPYDQFVREHIAGDLLASPRVDPADRTNQSIIGTGFYWLGEAKHSPVDTRQDEADRIDNQIDVFSKTFLALTVSCARCHDHKFDAISTRDYYALSGYLQSSRYQKAPIDLPEVFAPALQQLATQYANELAAAQVAVSQLASNRAQLEELFAALTTDEPLAAAAQAPTHPLYPYAVLSQMSPTEFIERKQQLRDALQSGSTPPSDGNTLLNFAKQFDDWFVTGHAFGSRPAPAGQLVSEPAGRAVAQRVVTAPTAHSGSLSGKLHGVVRSATFTIEQPKLHYRLFGTSGQVRLILDGLQLIRDPIYGGLQFGPDSEMPHWHTQDVSKWIGRRAYIEVIDDNDGYIALERVVANAGEPPAKRAAQSVIDALSDPEVTSLDALRERYLLLMSRVLDLPDSAVLRGDAVLANWVLTSLPLLPAARQAWQSKLEPLRASRGQIEAGIPQPRYALAMADGTGENEHVFIRGNHKQLAEQVGRRNLHVLSGDDQPAPARGSGRAELAERLLHDADYLLARVMVNRVWRHHFGQGLVSTPDDFGVMGQPPSHPELLDYLAAQFVREGWSLKALHRQMVLSSTYAMVSTERSDTVELDPANRLWHRMPLRRLEAECIRDAMLAVSGKLDSQLYGPSILPHLTEFMQGRGRPSASGPVDGAGRRSIYQAVRRNFLSPLLLAFDYPTPFTTIGRRTVSHLPAQALALLNNPFVHEQAGHWAQAILAAEHADDAARVAAMYEQAFGRNPEAEELRAALEFLDRRKAHSSDEPLAAYRALAHVLFNVKEFVLIR